MGPTPGALINYRQTGSSRTTSRTCLVNLANSRSITPRIVSRGFRPNPAEWSDNRVQTPEYRIANKNELDNTPVTSALDGNGTARSLTGANKGGLRRN
jgi:hypothetical protein